MSDFRRPMLPIALTTCVLLFGVSSRQWLCRPTFGAEEPQTNVLHIVIDDLRPPSGYYDDPIAPPPAIDRLAAMGVKFDQAYVQ